MARVQADPEVLLGKRAKLALAYPGRAGQMRREISRAQDGPSAGRMDGDRDRVRRDLGEAEAALIAACSSGPSGGSGSSNRARVSGGCTVIPGTVPVAPVSPAACR